MVISGAFNDAANISDYIVSIDKWLVYNELESDLQGSGRGLTDELFRLLHGVGYT